MIDPSRVSTAPIGAHPYASMGSTHDQSGQLWLVFRCTYCGDVSIKPCSSPQRAPQHGMHYGMMHAHGLTPRRR